MPKGRLTKRAVDAFVCDSRKDRDFLWDQGLAGFGLAAFPSGTKVYVVQYRQGGRSRRSSLGEHGRLTAEEARKAAKQLLGSVANGADPIAKRRANREIPTFRELADAFMTKHVAMKRKKRTYRSYQSLLRNHILPAIGGMRVTDIRRSLISKLHDDLAGTPGAANRVLSVVSAVWNWAAKQRDEADFPSNPATKIERYDEEGRERFLTSDELGRLGDVLREAETVGLPYVVDDAKPTAKHAPKPENRRRKLDPFAIAAIRLLILTGARLNEVLHARWDYVDAERGLLNLPSAKSKTGKRSIFLSAAALEVLNGVPRIESNAHLFPGEALDKAKEGKPRSDLKRPWAVITKAAGLEAVRLHDLRHSFASVGAGASLGLPIIGKLLGHVRSETTQRCSHLGADPLRRAADTIGNTITAAVNHEAGAKVVPMGRRRAD
jgi:integrase